MTSSYEDVIFLEIRYDGVSVNSITLIIIGFIGLCFGSFAGAQVWRLRARQLEDDKKAGEEYDKKEYKALHALAGRKQRDDRSQCLKCGHTLKWYDLLPLVSWISTKGRCRYCNERIGSFEPLIELGVAAVFVASYLFWPGELESSLGIASFVLWLIITVLLAILFAYDAKWFLLPDRITYPVIGLSAVFAGLSLVGSPNLFGALLSLIASIGILSGIYFVLWLVSRGRWIGFGDVKLGIALGLLVGSWELAFLTLFLANLIGCLIVIPGLLTKKMSRTTQVPFGPMLIAATIISVLYGQSMIAWYFSVTTTLLML